MSDGGRPRIMPIRRRTRAWDQLRTTHENIQQSLDPLINTLRFDARSYGPSAENPMHQRPPSWTFGDLVATFYTVANNETLTALAIISMVVGESTVTTHATTSDTTAANNNLKKYTVTATDLDLTTEDLVGVKIDPTNATDFAGVTLEFRPKPGVTG